MDNMLQATVQSATTAPEGSEYQVEVVSGQNVPEFATELRARARALREAGVLDTVSPNLEDIPLGNVERLTMVRSDPIMEDRGGRKVARLYTVIVKE